MSLRIKFALWLLKLISKKEIYKRDNNGRFVKRSIYDDPVVRERLEREKYAK